MTKLKTFLKDKSGATAIEYALIAAGIAVAIVTAVNSPRLHRQREVHDD